MNRSILVLIASIAAIFAFLIVVLGWLMVGGSSRQTAVATNTPSPMVEVGRITSSARASRGLDHAFEDGGAYPFAPTLEAAARELAAMVADARAPNERSVRVHVVARIDGKADDTGAEALRQELIRCITRSFVARDIPIATLGGRDPFDRALVVTAIPDHPQGPLLTARFDHDPKPRWRVIYRVPEESGFADVPRRGQVRVSFKTSLLDSPRDASDYAASILGSRIEREIYRLALAHGWIDERWREDFADSLRRRFAPEVLIAQGDYRVVPRVRSVDGVEMAESWVEWTARRRDLEDIARGVSSAVNVGRRLPWIKALVSAGIVILSILLWWRIDWWLDGNYGILSKSACAILCIAVVGLVWSFRFHG